MRKWAPYQTKYSNDTGDTIPVVIVAFHDMSDLWIHKEQYDKSGKFKGLLKDMQLSISSVRKVFHVNKKASSFPTQEWEG